MVAMGQQTLEFWRLKRVMEVTGLSKTEISRRVAAGTFPKPEKYPDSIMNFWPSTRVQAWQRGVLAEVADDFADLLG